MQNPTPTLRRPGRIRRALAILRTGTDPAAELALETARIEHRADCLIYQNTTAQHLIELFDAADTARAGSLLFA